MTMCVSRRMRKTSFWMALVHLPKGLMYLYANTYVVLLKMTERLLNQIAKKAEMTVRSNAQRSRFVNDPGLKMPKTTFSNYLYESTYVRR